MKPIALIPARQGSERLPDKNIKLLGGKALVQWAIDAALAAGIFEDRIYVSSNDPRALLMAKVRGVRTLARSPACANHQATLMMVLDEVRTQLHTRAPIYVLVPTSPFRNPARIATIHQWFLEHQDVNEIVSVVPDTPWWSLLRDKTTGEVRPVFPDRYHDGRKILPPAYRADGGHHLIGSGTGKVLGVPVPADEAVDINTEQDLLFAQWLLEQGKVKWLKSQAA